MIKITLKDDTLKEFESGVTPAAVAESLSPGLLKKACAAVLDGSTVDLRRPITKDASLSILTFEDADGRGAFWHTSSHILAQAVKRLYPDAKLAIGPAIAEGFYYDIETQNPLVPEDLSVIENEMKKIVKEGLPISRFTLPREEALSLMRGKNETYKTELINDLPEDAALMFYSQGEFTDLCAGPHLLNTSPVKAVKLLSLAGAYWRGNEKNKMLTRIYGISFPKASELDEYIVRIEEAKKRDHRKLGKELGLFAFMDDGPGFPFFLPGGTLIKNELVNYWREVHQRAGYQEISTPIMLNQRLWERSGHWEHYKNNMYTTDIEETQFAIKPMNCPGGMLVFMTQTRSYRDLPLRLGELGTNHRHEKSGTLHGLMRVRSFTQDDAHIFMTKEQIKGEIAGVIKLIDEVYSMLGFKYQVELSTRPENSMGSDQDWEYATNSLKEALGESGLKFKINEGDGAFYGPKIDFHLEDCIGRTWQCGTIQLDFQMPERFELEYVGADGLKHRPAMIHRVVFGSIERFIGVLTEHFAGAFPVWLSPVQAIVLPISDKHMDYADRICGTLKSRGIRADIDRRAEKVGFKIREARNMRIPYILVTGEKEENNGTVSLRDRSGDLGSFASDAAAELILRDISEKRLPDSDISLKNGG